MDVILKYFPDLTAVQREQISIFQREILTWNTRLNLVSRKDTAHLTERHVLHSLGIAACHRIPSASLVMDAGTGGGFPGIPLAIFFPQARFILVDSIGKKARAVKEIISALGLSNAEVRQARAETVDEKFHYIVGRAVTNLETFTGWVKGKILEPDREHPSNGILYLKGGDLTAELKSFPHAEVHHLDRFYSEPYFRTKKLIYLPYRFCHY
jgi:16S rRNA (guanine527-N7)-methyltransferase